MAQQQLGRLVRWQQASKVGGLAGVALTLWVSATSASPLATPTWTSTSNPALTPTGVTGSSLLWAPRECAGQLGGWR